MTELEFEAETRLLRWGESSAAGRTITLELPPGDGEAHPFRGFPTGHQHGQRFRMRFAPIDDNELVSRNPACLPPESRPPEESATPGPPKPPAAANPHVIELSTIAKGRYRELDRAGKLIVRASLLAKNPNFQKWAGCLNEGQARKWLRERCGVGSMTELHDSLMACDRFEWIETDYKLATGALPEVR